MEIKKWLEKWKRNDKKEDVKLAQELDRMAGEKAISSKEGDKSRSGNAPEGEFEKIMEEMEKRGIETRLEKELGQNKKGSDS